MKNILKLVFSKIGIGLCYGIGMAIVLLVTVYLNDEYQSKKRSLKKHEINEFAGENEEKKLIKEHKLIYKDGNRVEIIGLIENNSIYHWTPPTFEIEFYNDKKQFVYECTDKILNVIRPNQKENFKISCSSCGREFPKFSEYKLKIVDTYGKIHIE